MTRRIARKVIYLPESSSTNTEALRFARAQQPADGTVVIAGHQTEGRGQGPNSWVTASGMNLTFSVILIRPVNPEHLFRLNTIASLAVRDVLKKNLSQVPVEVKWPNDVYADGRKIAGILMESVIQGNAVQYAVIGIGLNVNQTEFPIPTATSMSLCAGIQFSLEHIFGELVLTLDHLTDRLQAGGWDELKADWLKDMYLRNVNHRFGSPDGEVDGVIRGIDESGRLLLETDHGIKTFMQRELIY